MGKVKKLIINSDKLKFLGSSTLHTYCNNYYIYVENTIFLINKFNTKLEELKNLLKSNFSKPLIFVVGNIINSGSLRIGPNNVYVHKILEYTEEIDTNVDIIVNYCNHPDCPIKLKEKILADPGNIEKWKLLVLQEENYQ